MSMISCGVRVRILHGWRNPTLNTSRSFHNNGGVCWKFITNTELIHRSVKYGHSAYPKRPNDPRVPSNPKFGQTHLMNNSNQPPVLSTDPNDPDHDGHLETVDLEQQKTSKKTIISKAMKVYLEKARQHNLFMQEQEKEFDIGRRHLANMMGLKLDSMNQSDIDLAIQYLMPSGLFDPRARPKMRPPKDIYPVIKQAQFGLDGRPFHSMFYTNKSNFYQTCFDLEEQMKYLKEYEDKQLKAGHLNPPEDSRIDFKSSEWLSYTDMKALFLEKIEPPKYDELIVALERLAAHPYSRLCENFLRKYRKTIKSAAEIREIPQLKYDADGRPYMNAVGHRKLCTAYVTVRGQGTGKVDINGQDIRYFNFIQDREQIMTPINFCGLLNKVDIECRTMHIEYTREYSEDSPPFPNGVRELGTSAQSGAIRYALSLALRSFVDRETVEKMRSVGLLTPDRRMKERKKWGQEGARRKYTWKKR